MIPDSWRYDTTAYDKRKKKRGCPNCYKKTYLTLEWGEKCPTCGEIMGIRYFFQSKSQLDKKGQGKWVPCGDEASAIKMAEKGYKVKKVVQPTLLGKCTCGKDGVMRVDNGLAAGIHCDECWKKLVTECRKQSW